MGRKNYRCRPPQGFMSNRGRVVRRLTRNQIPFGSAGSNPAGCEQVLRRSIGYQVGFLCGVRKTKRVQSVRLAEWSKA